MARKKTKVTIRITKKTDQGRKYFREISLPIGPVSAWKAICHGLHATQGIDVLKLRAERKRKGGK